VKFLADGNLGRLSKWLRILGYDAACHKGNIDLSCLMKAQREERIVLTRKAALAGRQYAGRLLVLRQDRLEQQIKELFEELSLSPDPALILTRCINCNTELTEISRGEAALAIAAHVLENCSVFRRCPSCGGIFWPGTHKNNILRFIKNRIPFHRP
jgi:uncharacterized protein